MKLALGLPIVEHMPGEAVAPFGNTVIECYECVGKDGFVLIAPNDFCPHDNARNAITNIAIAHECDRLLFMDDDTVFPKGAVAQLMKVMDERGATVVSGHYLRRGYPYTSVWSKQMNDEWYQVDVATGVHEIGSSGLGCCLIDLRKLVANVPKPWYRMRQNDNFTIITDDAVFFEALRKAGQLILGDASVHCIHYGRREAISRDTATDLRRASQSIQDLARAQIAEQEQKDQLNASTRIEHAVREQLVPVADVHQEVGLQA